MNTINIKRLVENLHFKADSPLPNQIESEMRLMRTRFHLMLEAVVRQMVISFKIIAWKSSISS
jgi:hypothetical protein